MAGESLRALVREVVAEVVRDLVAQEASTDRPVITRTSSARLPPDDSGPVVDPVQDTRRLPWGAVDPTGPRRSSREVHAVTIQTDDDLNAFARHIVRLLDNPKARMDLLAGATRFTLTRPPARGGAPERTHRRESGALTEREVKEAAEAGKSILLGRRAVVTPLARERARALGVTIEKET